MGNSARTFAVSPRACLQNPLRDGTFGPTRTFDLLHSRQTLGRERLLRLNREVNGCSGGWERVGVVILWLWPGKTEASIGARRPKQQIERVSVRVSTMIRAPLWHS
jgi:hypothetical protein